MLASMKVLKIDDKLLHVLLWRDLIHGFMGASEVPPLDTISLNLKKNESFFR